MATEKWIAGSGAGYAWTTCVSSGDLATLGSSNSVLASADITNQTAQDIFADVSINFQSVTTTGSPFIGVFLYPLNQDGTTYGDNQFSGGTGSANVPGTHYWKGSIDVPVGTQVLTGSVTGIVIPPGTFRFLIQNQAGVALGSTNNVKYRTYNRSIA